MFCSFPFFSSGSDEETETEEAELVDLVEADRVSQAGDEAVSINWTDSVCFFPQDPVMMEQLLV